MKLTKIAASVAISLSCLNGCGTTPKTPTTPLQFDYKAENKASTGIVQVYEMVGNTVVQIRNIKTVNPQFLDDNKAEISYVVIGESAVFTGSYASFDVVTPTGTSHVSRIPSSSATVTTLAVPNASISQTQTAAAQASNLQLAGVSKEIIERYGNVDEAQLRTEIARMQAEINRLKQCMNANNCEVVADANGNAAKPETKAEAMANAANIAQISTILVTFADNSTNFDPNPEIRNRLINLAQTAKEIEVTGYTDALKVSAAAANLAKSRAVAAKRYLVANGVDPKKIGVTYEAAGGFIADNSTKSGRDRNRRVEVSMM